MEYRADRRGTADTRPLAVKCDALASKNNVIKTYLEMLISKWPPIWPPNILAVGACQRSTGTQISTIIISTGVSASSAGAIHRAAGGGWAGESLHSGLLATPAAGTI